ncbi:MAG: ABC transporter permease [Deltaproteobacteria bacterium]|nr:ABC transporter permease [Deltaproteobacteria bacterium]
MHRVFAFVRCDLAIERSYRFVWVTRIVGLVFATALAFYFSRLVAVPSPALAPYGGNLLAFLVTGLAAQGMTGGAVARLTARLRESMVVGTFESLLLTRASPLEIAIGFQIVPLALQVGRIGATIAIAAFLFGVDFSRADWFAALTIVAIGIASLTALGFLAAAFYVWFRRGEPVSWAISLGGAFLGGLVFPVEFLPEPLQFVSNLLPVTHILSGIRRALLMGAGVGDLLSQILALLAFAVIMMPLAVALFTRAIDRALARGDINRY